MLMLILSNADAKSNTEQMLMLRKANAVTEENTSFG